MYTCGFWINAIISEEILNSRHEVIEYFLNFHNLCRLEAPPSPLIHGGAEYIGLHRIFYYCSSIFCLLLNMNFTRYFWNPVTDRIIVRENILSSVYCGSGGSGLMKRNEWIIFGFNEIVISKYNKFWRGKARQIGCTESRENWIMETRGWMRANWTECAARPLIANIRKWLGLSSL